MSALLSEESTPAKYQIQYDSQKKCYYHDEPALNAVTFESCMVRSEFQSRLEAYRKCLGLTREELSARSGVAVSMLTKYETHERDLRRAAYITVITLARTLGVDSDDLIDNEK